MKRKLLIISALALALNCFNIKAETVDVYTEDFEGDAATYVNAPSNDANSWDISDAYSLSASHSLHIKKDANNTAVIINRPISVSNGDKIKVTFNGRCAAVLSGGIEIRYSTTPTNSSMLTYGATQIKTWFAFNKLKTDAFTEISGQTVAVQSDETLYPYVFLTTPGAEAYIDDISFSVIKATEVIVPAVISVSNYETEILNTEYKRGEDSIEIATTFNCGTHGGVGYTADSLEVSFAEINTDNWSAFEGRSVSVMNKSTEVVGVNTATITTKFLVPASYDLTSALAENLKFRIQSIVYYNEGLNVSVVEDGITVVEGSSTGVSAVSTNKESIFVNNGIVFINSDVEKMVNVYSISGVLVESVNLNSGENTISNLDKGIYLIDRKKVIIK